MKKGILKETEYIFFIFQYANFSDSLFRKKGTTFGL